MSPRDIFKDGPSPELQAEWDRIEELEKRYWAAYNYGRTVLLKQHPELAEYVLCPECKQSLPGPPAGREIV